MTRKLAQKVFNVLIITAAVLMIWQLRLPDHQAGFAWQGIGACVLCVAAIAVHFKWVRCPHCGKVIARGAKTHCTYCGKAFEEDK